MLALLRTRRRRCRGGILDYRWAAFWKSLGRPGRMADSIEQMGWLLSISRRRAASRDRTEESLMAEHGVGRLVELSRTYVTKR
jgi:hypothetical protein